MHLLSEAFVHSVAVSQLLLVIPLLLLQLLQSPFILLLLQLDVLLHNRLKVLVYQMLVECVIYLRLG